MNTPILNIPLVPQGALDVAAGTNDAIRVLDVLVQTAPISMSLTAPPGTSSDGDLYVVAGEGGVATGDWAGQENNLARYVDDGNFWEFYEAGVQVHLLLNQEDGNLYKYVDGSPPGWVLAAGLGDAPADGDLYARRDATWEAFVAGVSVTDENSPPTLDPEISELIIADGLVLEVMTGGVARISAAPLPVAIQVACSDQTTDLAAANGVATFRAPHAFTLTEVRASINTTSSSGDVVVDVNKNGATVLSTLVSIDQGEKTSVTGSPAAVISDDAIGDDDEITVDIDNAGTGAKGLIVTLIGYRS
jgi:hypothetical protein